MGVLHAALLHLLKLVQLLHFRFTQYVVIDAEVVDLAVEEVTHLPFTVETTNPEWVSRRWF